jgi:phosphomannomutase/phosphoglucomutase
MAEINATIFRAYDIRGIYGKDVTLEIAEKIGIAFGNFIGEGKTIVVSKDLRRSGEELKERIVSGLMSSGCNVIDLGTATTPMNYFAVHHLNADGGVSITGSHLTSEYNGFKLTKEGAASLTGEMGIYRIRDAVISGSLKKASRNGIRKSYDIYNDYANFVLSKSNVGKKLKVLVDIGNGTCGKIVKKILDRMNLDVEYIFFDMDDTFPNHIANPIIDSTLETLQREVVARKADLGIAFDGDGDRVGFVDDKGRIIRGDMAMMIFVKGMLEKKEKQNLKFLFDVLCTRALTEFTKKSGGIVKLVKVGHSYIMKALKEEKGAFAGELSGHYYFIDSFGYDDAVFSAAKMLEILSNESRKLSEIIDLFPKYESTPDIRIDYPDEKKFELIERLITVFKGKGHQVLTIDGVKVEYDDGWGLVRASNTEPKLVLRFEAKTKERVIQIQNEIMTEMKMEAKKDGINI